MSKPAEAQHLDEREPAGRGSLATMLADLNRRYGQLFDCRFPYAMGWQAEPYGLDGAGYFPAIPTGRVHAEDCKP
jgi:galactose-1-phosphate uridylyltransferase